MPSSLFADRPAPQPPERGAVDALITQASRLRGDVDAVRQDAGHDDDLLRRWQRALCDLAVNQLDDLRAHLDLLKAGGPEADEDEAPGSRSNGAPESPSFRGSLVGRVGSAEWNLLNDEVSWSDELYQIFGRLPGSGPLSLDELPSLVLPEDQGLLTAMVTGCLIDGRPIDGEFRIVRPDQEIRTLHMMGEPVLDAEGCTASMWAVLRDVSAVRQGEREVSESRDLLQRRRQVARTEDRLVAEMQEAVLPSRSSSLHLTQSGPAALDLAAHHLPSASASLVGGDWYDALELPGGDTLLATGDLTGQGVTTASTLAMLLGALRGMAVAGIQPGALLGHLNQLLETARRPALGSVLCARYHPATRSFAWAQAGHPAPLLFREGTGHTVTSPDGVLLGATSGAVYEQAEIRLLPGDLLVLHTDGLTRDTGVAAARQDRILGLGPRLAETRTARAGARVVLEEFGPAARRNDACVMVARVGA